MSGFSFSTLPNQTGVHEHLQVRMEGEIPQFWKKDSKEDLLARWGQERPKSKNNADFTGLTIVTSCVFILWTYMNGRQKYCKNLNSTDKEYIDYNVSYHHCLIPSEECIYLHSVVHSLPQILQNLFCYTYT